MPGARLGKRYEIISFLGRGGTGVVYLARDTVLERVVALKLLAPERRQDVKATRRLRREARAMARISDDGVTRVFDHGTDPAFGPFVVMERLEGEDLSRYLKRRGRLPVRLALAFLEQLCVTLEAAHEVGVLHRDLKPANLFVCRPTAGGRARLKVLDFGLATVPATEAPLTEPGDVLGTFAYMPPERWRRDGNAGPQTDVYGLGAVAHEMLSGEPPFRAETLTELRLAVANDLPTPLNEIRADVPPAVARAVLRAMSKAPSARFADVAAFAEALGLATVTRPPASSRGGEALFRGTARFAVSKRLGGGHGTEVYAARDIDRGRLVALKRVRSDDADAVARLQHEYRVATAIRHENIVHVHELVDEGAHALLVMELVAGAPFLDYVAGSEEHLRSSLLQLARGLDALHRMGVVHCDVTPANVVVEEGGRLVLLDFGVASEASRPRAAKGTPGYVAPEALEGNAGPAADLYAVGALLHVALTFQPPPDPEADGPAPARKKSGVRGIGNTALSKVPRSDLSVLCARLLEPDPMNRASIADILQVVGGPQDDVRAPAAPDSFVGRADALAALFDARARAVAGAPGVVWVNGASGIGKTTLLDRFRQALESQGNAVVLRGRARQGGPSPFPLLDDLIEDLAHCLNCLPRGAVDMLVPRRSGALSHLFPALLRVPSIARGAKDGGESQNPAQLRQEACETLRELLRRLNERRSVILLLDDLQWLDEDSEALLVSLLRGTDLPVALLVGAFRADGLEGTTRFDAFASKLSAPASRVHLDPLTFAESRALLGSRWRGLAPLPADVAAGLAKQSGGIPFFVDLLARNGAPMPGAGQDALNEVLVAMHRALPAPAQRAFGMLCASSRPLEGSVLLDALGADDPHDLDPLFSRSWVRSLGVNGAPALEPRHTRMRDAVLGSMSAEERRQHHHRLAKVLRARSDVDPEALVEHLAEAGHPGDAADLALTAARRANDHLGFDRAAHLYAFALGCAGPHQENRVALTRLYAEALQNAGHRRRAGEVLLLEAERDDTGQEAAFELRREAGGHLLLSGALNAGLHALGPALARAGVDLPRDAAEAMQTSERALFALASRGIGVAAWEGEAASPEALERIDLCLLLAQGLTLIDVRAVPFACIGLQAALDIGEPSRLQRAAAFFVLSTAGHIPEALVLPVLQLCRALTDQASSPYARALFAAAEAQHANFAGDFLVSEASFERAERLLLESCAGATRELATVRDMAAFVHYAHKGDFRTQLPRTQQWLAEACAQNDAFHSAMLRVAHAIVWIAHDQVARARSELSRAESEWGGSGGTLEVAAALYHDIADRYDAAPGVARRATSRGAEVIAQHAAHSPFLGGYVVLHATWGRLREVAFGVARASELPSIRTSIAPLRTLGMDVWAAVADALEANADYLEGHRELALASIERAERTFRGLYMLCLAACARKRRGQFTGGPLGARLEDEADDDLRTLGVVDVNRWAHAYWSMFDARANDRPTQASG